MWTLFLSVGSIYLMKLSIKVASKITCMTCLFTVQKLARVLASPISKWTVIVLDTFSFVSDTLQVCGMSC